MIKLYSLSKQIHNILVVFISIIGLAMALTGMVLKFPILSKTFSFFDYESARLLHNQLSTVFGFTFILMAATGIVMYIFYNRKKK